MQGRAPTPQTHTQQYIQISQLLKNFSDMYQSSPECVVFPAVREILTKFPFNEWCVVEFCFTFCTVYDNYVLWLCNKYQECCQISYKDHINILSFLMLFILGLQHIYQSCLLVEMFDFLMHQNLYYIRPFICNKRCYFSYFLFVTKVFTSVHGGRSLHHMGQFFSDIRLCCKFSNSMYHRWAVLSYHISIGHISTIPCSFFFPKTNSSSNWV
jgi:hypothetical protein